jgi:AcrR family transcriptional regulator
MHKDQISEAALLVLKRDGLQQWTISAVALEAGCAKGLVHYHHHTKEELLGTVADQAVRDRTESRITALSGRSTAALDALWTVLASSVEGGQTASWLSLSGHPSPAVRSRIVLPGDYLGRLSESISQAFSLAAVDESTALAIDAGLDGLEVALLRGDAQERVHEAFHQMWLAVL